MQENILASNTWTSNDRKVMVIDELNFKTSDKHILTSHKMKAKCLFPLKFFVKLFDSLNINYYNSVEFDLTR